VRAFLVVLIGAVVVGGCAAKQKELPTQPASDPATSGAASPGSPNNRVSPNNVDLARDEYDRAVADYQTAF
jgi:hypothetical protein